MAGIAANSSTAGNRRVTIILEDKKSANEEIGLTDEKMLPLADLFL